MDHFVGDCLNTVYCLHLTWPVSSYIKNHVAQLSICNFGYIVQTAHYPKCNMNVIFRRQWWIIITSIHAAITNHKFIVEILES